MPFVWLPCCWLRRKGLEPPPLPLLEAACSPRRSPSTAADRMLHRPRPNLPPSATTRIAPGGCSRRDVTHVRPCKSPPLLSRPVAFPLTTTMLDMRTRPSDCIRSAVASFWGIGDQVSPARGVMIDPPLCEKNKTVCVLLYFN